MRDFLLLCSTLALLLSGFIAMNRLDNWIENEQQRILSELRTDTSENEHPEETLNENLPEPTPEPSGRKKPVQRKYREYHWICSKLCDKMFLPKHTANYRGTGQCSSYKKGI